MEILNPDLVICTLDDGANLRMELTINNGKGYVPAEQNRPDDAPIGLIAINSIYSPVRRVAYRVENTREGQVLDYDKLIIEVETNGAIRPEDAIAYAARILQDQLQVFITFEEPKQKKEGGEKPDLPFNPALLKKVDELEECLGLGRYAHRLDALEPLVRVLAVHLAGEFVDAAALGLPIVALPHLVGGDLCRGRRRAGEQQGGKREGGRGPAPTAHVVHARGCAAAVQLARCAQGRGCAVGD